MSRSRTLMLSTIFSTSALALAALVAAPSPAAASAPAACSGAGNTSCPPVLLGCEQVAGGVICYYGQDYQTVIYV